MSFVIIKQKSRYVPFMIKHYKKGLLFFFLGYPPDQESSPSIQ